MSDSFAGLGLSADIIRAVSEQGYTEPTPIQSKAIPVVLARRDVLAAAQTGTGKTAGFTLPMLQLLAPQANASASPARHPVRALIVTPTRELAAQIEESVRVYGKYVRLRSALIYGGVGMAPQVDALRAGVDILVATPGRLLDHVQQRTVNLSQVEILVLDEADRMLDMGFIRDIRRILALLPAKRQNLLFSATFTDDIRKLASGLLNDPVQVEVARRNAESDLVEQRVYAVERDRKRHLLSHLVRSGDWRQVLVFTKTKHGANRLAEQLARDGIETAAIHGNKSQPQRLKALASFKEGAVRVLVATDIAARGLDIEELPHVVNYDLPHVAEDYVHRIGRTGRAGSRGEAISLVCAEERPLLAAIERLLRRPLARGDTSQYAAALAALPSEPATGARPAQARRTAARSNEPAQPGRDQRGRRGAAAGARRAPSVAGAMPVHSARQEADGNRTARAAAHDEPDGNRAVNPRDRADPNGNDAGTRRTGTGQRRASSADRRAPRTGDPRARGERPHRSRPSSEPSRDRPDPAHGVPLAPPAAAAVRADEHPSLESKSTSGPRAGPIASLLRFFSPRPGRSA